MRSPEFAGRRTLVLVTRQDDERRSCLTTGHAARGKRRFGGRPSPAVEGAFSHVDFKNSRCGFKNAVEKIEDSFVFSYAVVSPNMGLLSSIRGQQVRGAR
jgi:hypothetical protein